MHSFIIGTAGHIDHGKTSLVKALTGIDTDRLKEEKSRGITIELGFAHLALGEKLLAGVVDVPGHERFVKNMVAGTTGIDLVLLVVAADEGVMPQTREHLDICTLLGVERGVVALTKTDLVDDPTWLEMVTEDLAAELEGTFLEESPVVQVSARSGAGLDELVKVLKEQAKTIEPRPRDAPAFLGIDRAFSMHGFGTVVTGTLVSGTFQVEESVDVLPDESGKLRGLKIRGLQVHGDDVDRADAGRRVAVNLSGIERALLSRGQALAHSKTLQAGQNFECNLRLVTGAKPARSRTRAIFHTGTAKSAATVRLIDRDILHPGDMCYVNIHCEEPLAALPGHHYILRGFTTIKDRGTTSGGGKIVAILPPRHRRKEMDRWQSELRTLDQGNLGERLLVLLRRSGLNGAGVEELRMRAAAGLKSINRELDKLMAERKALKYDREQNRFIESSVLEDLISKAEGVVSGFHRTNPKLPGIPAEQLRSTLSHNLDVRMFRLLVDELYRREIAVQEGDIVRISSHRVRLDANETKLTGEVRRKYTQAGLAPPRPDEVAQELGRPESEVMELVRHLARTGHLTHVSKDMYVSTDAVDDLRTRLISHLNQHGEITTQSFKSLVGGTRKHVIPLAEFFDREKTTLRVGDKRVLRRKGSENG